MTHAKISTLEREISELKYEDDCIKNDVSKIKSILQRTPEPFSHNDILRAFIGSLFLGFSVAFSGNILNIARAIPETHIYVMTIFSLVVLTAEIYFIGYRRVEDKHTRKFGQFWLKRIITFYAVAISVAFLLSYVIGLIYLAESPTIYYHTVLLISVPCAIGASVSDLLKKY